MSRIKQILPRGIYGRAALILIVPIVAIQLVVSTAFIQRHYEGVTQQLTEGVAIDLAFVLRAFARGDTPEQSMRLAAPLAEGLGFSLIRPDDHIRLDDASQRPLAPARDRADWLDFSGRAIIRTLHSAVPAVQAVDVTRDDRMAFLRIETKHGDLLAEISRRRMTASNPHQLLVLMVVASVLMTLIAFIFLRNQLRPIQRLGAAAEAFGRGERMAYRPRGAVEVRAAGRAFLDMRARIERQIEQRTLMLSGISHDLRTPLTRMRLELSLMDDSEETRALAGDVAEMERMVDEFLSFIRGDATEHEVETDLVQLVDDLIAQARRGGGHAELGRVGGARRMMRLRPEALRRALMNLVSNGLRYGRHVEISIHFGEEEVTVYVEDDGPGIPEERRDEAMRPFSRLDAARDPNHGGGVGLGLSIATDIAFSHGGQLRLERSARLGGLKVAFVIRR